MRGLVLVLALIASSSAHAEDFGGWKFTAPAKATRSVTSDTVVFTQISGDKFCLFGLRSTRPPTGDDVAVEWKTVIEDNFKVESLGPNGTYTTKRGLSTVVTTATVRDKVDDKESFVVALYTLAAQGAVGSLTILSKDNAMISSCPVAAMLDSIELITRPAAVPAPGPAAPAQPAQPSSAPAAAVESIVGAWATASGNPSAASGTSSVSRRQYTFKADGTYSYFSEVFDGYSTWIHVREAGTYQIAGDKLTIAPTTSMISSRDWKAVRSTKKQPLEKVTYAFKKHYFSGLKEWNLVLTPGKATDRDGPFAVNNQFPNSYLLSNTFKPEWKWP